MKILLAEDEKQLSPRIGHGDEECRLRCRSSFQWSRSN
jgi:hypothetical protein